jgi:hypothetical protein
MSDEKKIDEEQLLTLSDDDIVEAPETDRRGAMRFLGIAALGAAVAAFFGNTQEAEAQRCTDSDPNDGVGRGRRCAPRYRTGITDRDPNDGVGAGRGYRRPVYRRPVYRRRCTDSDSGSYADPGGRGRHC